MTIDPSRVVVTSGASGAFLLAFSALFDNGAKVGLGLPCYPSYRQILKAMGVQAIEMPTTHEARYQPVPGDVADHSLDGLIVASPANPTGTMLDIDEMRALSDACQAQGTAFISDEIYHGIDYDKKPVTALQVTDEVYVINSFSKYFSMTGWRVGWMIVPQDHVRRVERLAQNMFICPAHASQRLALAALECDDELQGNLSVYKENRQVRMAQLPKAGFDKIAPPDGAFYVYADVSAHTDNALEFAKEILDQAGVAVTPGLDFDPVEGHKWIRFSYAGATGDMIEGLARLKTFMEQRSL